MLTAKRAPDFSYTGDYYVTDETGTRVAVIYRDPESRDWYRMDAPGHYSVNWLGSTKAEALATLARKLGRV